MNYFNVQINPSIDSTHVASFQHPLTKRRVRLHFLTKDDATVYKQRIEQRFKKTKFENYESLTIEELLLFFIRKVPNNHFTQKKIHLIDFAETFADHTIYELTGKTLKGWLDQIQLENRIKNVTMRGIKAEIETFFSFLKDEEIISESPLSMVNYQVKTKAIKSRNILTTDDLKDLEAALNEYSPGYLYPIIKTFIETGAKSSEIIELTWDQLSLKENMIHLKERDKSKARSLTISTELAHLLKLKDKKGERVFRTYYDEPFTYEKLRSAIREFKKKKMFEKEWIVADLRHSYAVNFLKAGGTMNELSEQLGHSSVYETNKLYGGAMKPSKNTMIKDL